MIYVELVFNLTLLVALTVVSGFIDQRAGHHTRLNHLLQGALFGGAAVVGMLQPFVLGPGLIFDGRSVMVSLCALYFGPLATTVATVMTIACRIAIGGVGAVMGVAVILTSSAIGLFAHYRFDPEARPPRAAELYLFGVVVHLGMLACMLMLPGTTALAVFSRVGPPVMLLFPLATILVGKLLSDQAVASRTMTDLEQAKRSLTTTLRSIGDGVVSTDLGRNVVFLNPAAEAMTGWSRNEALGRPLSEVVQFASEGGGDRTMSAAPGAREGGTDALVGRGTMLVARDGRLRPVAESEAPIRDSDGAVSGAVLVLRDQEGERRLQRLIQARLTLLEYALAHSLDDVVNQGLEQVGDISRSPVVVFEIPGAAGNDPAGGTAGGVDRFTFCSCDEQAGVPEDRFAKAKAYCLDTRTPYVGNEIGDASPAVRRELMIPIVRGGTVMALLGVADRPSDYDDRDLGILIYLGDLMWQLVEQKRAEDTSRTNDMLLRIAGRTANFGGWSVTLADGRVSWSDQTAAIHGMPPGFSPMIEEAMAFLASEFRARFEEAFSRCAADGTPYDEVLQIVKPDGARVWVRAIGEALRDERGRIVKVQGAFQDIDETTRAEASRRQLQAQLDQASKLESVGRLAGGIAHDFNNMLGVILGSVDLAMMSLAPDDPLSTELREIRSAASRSADLTRQLLAFARKQPIAPRTLDLNEAVESMLKLLRRIIGEHIELTWIPGTALGNVCVDPSQISQLLANLCVNSRDAITGVGKVTIETHNAVLDERFCLAHEGCIPGDYVELVVRDDGHGMDQATLQNVFEPFFTTKDVGRGTGLGLATVYGIVRQNEGAVTVESAPGKGTTFRIYLPRRASVEEQAEGTARPVPPRGGKGTVLLVEDQPELLALCRRMLEKLGYTVLAADTPGAAIVIAETNTTALQLLMTDVVMPEMNGVDLARHIQTLIPDLRCLLMSGYPDEVLSPNGTMVEGVHFIQKPFSIGDLAIKLREVVEPSEVPLPRISTFNM